MDIMNEEEKWNTIKGKLKNLSKEELIDVLTSINMSKIEEAFRGLGRTEKVRFISQNIEYANAVAVASYVKGYLFDVLNDVGDDEYIAAYLREKGYEVKKQE